MAHFDDLPLEILPLVIEKIRRVHSLAQICLVNKTFYAFAVQLLYRQICVFSWHGKQKIRRVFSTLADYPHLATHVLRIEIRDFPRGLKGEERDQLFEMCLRGLGNCINLLSCTWTRDGSLNSAILHQLQACATLWSLTINGQHHWKYDPNILTEFTRLRELSIIMPSPVVLHTVERSNFNELESFSLICKSAPIINDEFLSLLAPRMPNLRKLHLTNCAKVSDAGVVDFIAQSQNGIVDLALEGKFTDFDLARFSSTCAGTSLLANLRAITLTVPAPAPPKGLEVLRLWFQALLTIVGAAPLEQLHVYASSEMTVYAIPDDFVRAVAEIDAHCARLRRFSVHRLGISIPAIALLCASCDILEELFITVADNQLSSIGPALSTSSSLRSIHLNLTAAGEGSPMFVMPDVATDIVRECGSSVTQFGCSTRVWHVVRTVSRGTDGELKVERTLGPYEAPEIPEQFLVVRT